MLGKKERSPETTRKNKERRQKKRKRRHEYWKDNKDYLSRQAERKEKLASYKQGSKFAKKAENEERLRLEKEERKKQRRRR